MPKGISSICPIIYNDFHMSRITFTYMLILILFFTIHAIKHVKDKIYVKPSWACWIEIVSRSFGDAVHEMKQIRR